MTILAYALPGYLLGSFLLSAGTVRLAPRAYSSRQIRRNFRLFLALPVLLIFDFVHLLHAIYRHGSRLLRSTFELLSGQRLFDGDLRAFGYFGQEAPAHQRRKNKRPDVPNAASPSLSAKA